MSAIINCGTVLAIALCVTIFFYFVDAIPVTVGNKETSSFQDDLRLRRQNNFGVKSQDPKTAEMEAYKTATAQAARMPNGKYPDIEIFFADLDLYDTKPQGNQPEQNNSTKPSKKPNFRNIEPRGTDDGLFSVEMEFFYPETRNSVLLTGENQDHQFGATDFGDPTLQRGQKASRNVEHGRNYDFFSFDRLFDFFWPQFKKDDKEDISKRLSKKQSAKPNLGTSDQIFNLFWPQSTRNEIAKDEKQNVDHLLKKQGQKPILEPIENDNGAFGFDQVFDLFWPQSTRNEIAKDEKQKVDHLLKKQRQKPILEPIENDNGAFGFDQVFDLFWPQIEKEDSIHDRKYIDRTLLRGQRAAPNVEPRNAIDRDVQDMLWSKPMNTDIVSEDRNRDVTFVEGQGSALQIVPRDIQEGETEITTYPNKPADISYESNMLYYFVTVTLPSFIGLTLAIILCCYCMKTDGYCCRIFDERPPDILEEDADEFDEGSRAFKKGQVV